LTPIYRFPAVVAILILVAALPHPVSAAEVFCMPDPGIVVEGREAVVHVFANWNGGALATARFSASGGVIQRDVPTRPRESAAARWTALDNRGTFEATVAMTSTNGESASCVVRIAVVGSDYGSPGTEAGRIWLRSAESQKPGYGAYTYLLLPAPTQATLDRQKMTIEVLLRRIFDWREMQKQFEKKQLNIVSLPVKDPPKKENDPDAVLTLYDYPHARRLLNMIDPALRAGPYLVTVPEPIESAKKSDRIILDLSGLPPKDVEYWASAYFDQLAQQSLWGKPFEPPVTLRLRTLISVVGLAVPDVSAAAERLIKVLGAK
jgi:hypothetical protein